MDRDELWTVKSVHSEGARQTSRHAALKFPNAAFLPGTRLPLRLSGPPVKGVTRAEPRHRPFVKGPVVPRGVALPPLVVATP